MHFTGAFRQITKHSRRRIIDVVHCSFDSPERKLSKRDDAIGVSVVGQIIERGEEAVHTIAPTARLTPTDALPVGVGGCDDPLSPTLVVERCRGCRGCLGQQRRLEAAIDGHPIDRDLTKPFDRKRQNVGGQDLGLTEFRAALLARRGCSARALSNFGERDRDAVFAERSVVGVGACARPVGRSAGQEFGAIRLGAGNSCDAPGRVGVSSMISTCPDRAYASPRANTFAPANLRTVALSNVSPII